MKASELIKQLELAIIQYGDREVYAGGEDYPGKVNSIGIQDYKSSYIPYGSFKIHVRDSL